MSWFGARFVHGIVSDYPDLAAEDLPRFCTLWMAKAQRANLRHAPPMARRPHFVPPPFHPDRPGLVAPVRIDPSGEAGPTENQARGPRWRRVSQGLYVPADVDRDGVEQRILEAAAVLPPVGGLTGWASLRWLGGGTWFDGLDSHGLARRPVDLATCYQDVRSQPGFVVHQERLGPSELIEVDGLRTTTAVRSLCFMMRHATDVWTAVQHADMAAFADLVSIDECAAYLAEHPGWTGVPRAREAGLRMDENSWSRPETWMRLVWQIEAGFPRPLCNRPIFDRSGRHIATPDLLDPESGTYGEYDGAMHLEGKRRAKDEVRANALRTWGSRASRSWRPTSPVRGRPPRGWSMREGVPGGNSRRIVSGPSTRRDGGPRPTPWSCGGS